MVCLAGGNDREQIVKGSPVGGCRDPFVEIIPQWNVGLYLKPFRLIDWVTDAIAEPSRYGQISLYLPNIVHITVIFLGGEVANVRLAQLLQTSIDIERKDSRV